MSSDTYIGIGKFKDGYRVCYGQAPGNSTYYPKGSKEEFDTVWDMFCNSILYDREGALKKASLLLDTYDNNLYGIEHGILEFDFSHIEIPNKDKKEIRIMDSGASNDSMENSTFRTFPSGSTRDIDIGKLQYSKYINPLNDYSFAQYMLSKQFIGGEWREGDNWQKGLGEDSLFQSLVRHIEIVKLLIAGYNVVEFKEKGVVKLSIFNSIEELQNDIEEKEKNSDISDIQVKDIVSELNACRFNSEGLKLYKLGFYDY